MPAKGGGSDGDHHASGPLLATNAAPPSSSSSFRLNLLAGGGAGVIETMTTYPLDLVRTRIQMTRGTSTSTVAGLLLQIVREEGAARVYRGLLPPLVSEVPRRALKFTANDFYKQRLLQFDGQPHSGCCGHEVVCKSDLAKVFSWAADCFLSIHRGPASLSVAQATIAGTLTGMTETLIHTPFEVLKIRLQSREFSHCKNMKACARELLEKEGPLGFYRGFEAYLWRQGTWNGTFFGMIALVRERWPITKVTFVAGSNGDDKATRRAYDFWTGLAAGTLATCVNTPLDVVKTRISCMTATVGQTRTVPWAFPLLATIYEKEGVRACFKGLNARLYRAAPGSGILLVVYESIVDMLT